MILLVTRKSEPHADVLVDRLESLGAEVGRLNWDDYPQKIILTVDIDERGWDAKLELPAGRIVDVSCVTAAWCRRGPSAIPAATIVPPKARALAQEECESAINGLLSLLENRFWMNYPGRVARAYSKMLQLVIARKVGFSIPQTRITANANSFVSFLDSLGGSAVTKLIGIVYSIREDHQLLYTNVLDRGAVDDASSVRFCPTLIQELVPKAKEYRVTVVCDQVFSMSIESQQKSATKVDWRRGSQDDLKAIGSAEKLPREYELRCKAFLQEFGLAYGAFDFILTPEDDLIFLEMNPHGAWGFVEQATSLPISEAIARHLLAGQ